MKGRKAVWKNEMCSEKNIYEQDFLSLSEGSNPVVEFDIDNEYFSLSDDTNDLTINNWLNSNSDEESDSASTMSIYDVNDDSSIESDVRSFSGCLDDDSYAEEMYSDYNTYDDVSDDDVSHVEHGFSMTYDDESQTTIPTEYMTEENQRRNIPMVIGHITKVVKTKRDRNKTKVKLFKILLDSGATGNLIVDYLVQNIDKNKVNDVVYTTANGEFTTSEACDVKFDMPELWTTKEINLTFNVFNNDSNLPYDMIIGTD